MIDYRLINPVDVLFFRGNRLFGEAGDHADAEMPPWPSVFSGALRSRILVDRGVSFERFLAGDVSDPELKKSLGSPAEPGDFRLSFFSLFDRKQQDIVFPLPADLFSAREQVLQAFPVRKGRFGGAGCSNELPCLPILAAGKSEKPKPGMWLTGKGLRAYLRGEKVNPGHLIAASDLWKIDDRLGIGLEAETGTVKEGLLYTSQAVALCPDSAFLVGCSGAGSLIPKGGLIRLGGDGRGAALAPFSPPAEGWPQNTLPRTDTFRMILATPGIFPGGWVPPGVSRRPDGEYVWECGSLKARLVAAAVSGYRTISGWDVAEHAPKPAQRVVPAGSVFWFEKLEGDRNDLMSVLEGGLWPLFENFQNRESSEIRNWKVRRAEGFNNIWFGDCPAEPGN